MCLVISLVIVLQGINRDYAALLLVDKDIGLSCNGIMNGKQLHHYTGRRQERLRLECELITKCVTICSQLLEMMQRYKCSSQLAGFEPTDYAETLDRINT